MQNLKMELTNNESSEKVEYLLKDCVDILDNQRIPVNSEERNKRVGNVPYYGATGQVGLIDDYIFDEELVLLGEDGAPFLDKSKPIAYIVTGKSWVNNHAHVLRAKKGIANNRFIKYYLDYFDYSDSVAGTTRLKLTQSSMRNIPIRLPSLSIQEKVAMEIQNIISNGDEAKQKIQKAKKIVSKFRQAILTAAVTGKLTDNWRIENIPIFKKSKFSGKKFDIEVSENTDLFDIPESWKWEAIGNYADIIDPQPSHRTPPSANEGVPYIGMGDINSDGSINFEESRKVSVDILQEHNKRYQLKLGDFIFGKIGTLGKPVLIPVNQKYTLSANVVLVQSNPSLIISQYLYFYLSSKLVEKILLIDSRATSQPAFGIKRLRTFPLPLPSIEEQEEIVKRVNAYFEVVTQIEYQIKKAEAKVSKLTQAILAKTFKNN